MVRRGLLSWLAVLIMLVSHPKANGASAGPNQLLTDSELYARMKRELKERLGREERLTLLPRNLDGVSVACDRLPVFWMQHAGVGLPGVETAVTTWRENHEGFRLVCDGEVLGASASEAVLAAHDGHGTRKCVVVSSTTDRRFDQFLREGEAHAMRTPFGWWAVYDNGLIQTNLVVGHPADFPGVSWRMNGTNEVILVTRAEGGMATDRTTMLTIWSWTDKRLAKEVFIVGRHEALARQGVVRLRDGRWLSLDYCLRVLASNTPPNQVAEERAAVIAAAGAGNRAAFFQALERISGRHPQDTKALCDELAALPEAVPRGERIEAGIKSEIEQLRNWTPPPELAAAAADRVRESVSNHVARMELALRRVQESRGGPLGISPAKVAELVRRNFQFFDGRWIQDVRSIRQDRADQALVQATFLDELFESHLGIFLLDQDRHLTLLGTFSPMAEPRSQYARPSSSAACQSVRLPDGSEFLFFQRRGLARLGGGKLEWVDCTAPFKIMREVLGCDRLGRIFLSSDPAPALKSGNIQSWQPKRSDFWVYRPKLRAPPTAVARLYPVNSRPIMDREQRVWFVSNLPERNQPTNVLGSLADLEAAVVAAQELAQSPPMDITVSGAPERRREYGFGQPVGLFCLQQGRCLSVQSNVPADLLLLNGSEGAVFGVSRSDRVPAAFWIQGHALTIATNLHELATNRFDELLRAAPLEGLPPRQFLRSRSSSYWVPANPAFYRSDDVVWINQSTGIEAYRQGRPLGVRTRLELMNSTPDAAVLLGPLRTSLGLAQVIVSVDTYRAGQVIWAYPRADGVDLRRGGKPDFAQIGLLAGYTPIYDFPSGPDLSPVASLSTGRIFSSNNDLVLESSGQTNFVFIRDAGQPALVMRTGELLVERVAPAYSGYRLCAGEVRHDLVETFFRPLRLSEETGDGDLLASNAEGLLWLRRDASGEYKVRREAKLHLGGEIHSLVGETTNQMFVTVIDSQSQAYLAVIQKLLLP